MDADSLHSHAATLIVNDSVYQQHYLHPLGYIRSPRRVTYMTNTDYYYKFN